MKKLLLAFVAIAAFSSCSSDDAAAPVTGESISVVGTWNEVSYQLTPNMAWTDFDCENTMFVASQVIFNSNGTFTGDPICEDANAGPVSGTYTVQGDVLTFNFNGYTLTHKISAEGSTVLYLHSFEVDNGQTTYYKKVKLVKQ